MSSRDKYFKRFPIPAVGPKNPHCSQLIVRKSRFLAHACICGGRSSAMDFTDIIRARNPGATHNCWAYIAGPPGDSANVGSSDDGEPHGTAGRPMLQVLLHSGIGQICIVVSRWFGGIKLGTGGLARAYQDSVLENLKTLPVKERINSVHCRIILGYSYLDIARRLLAEYEAEVSAEAFNDKVELELAVPADKWKEFRSEMAALGGGQENLCQIVESG